MALTLPAQGRAADDILAELRAFKADDCDWQHGRSPAFVFKADEPLYELGRAAFFEYFSENALGAGRAFPSLKKMEREVVAMALSLFAAPDKAQGFMTSGGTESILQAVQTCRDWSRQQRGDVTHRGNIVAPASVHPAFDKAAKLMDLQVRRAPVGADLRADLTAMEALIDADTILLVGSAPCFPYGVIDPIAQIGTLALRRQIWLHVDACVGGYLAPFARLNGRDIPAFDFSVPGVQSLSADLHKFGFCPKPASTVFYRSPDLARHHQFDNDAWPGGRFVTPTLVGTRPAGGVAAAWAVFQYLGFAGYQKIARELMGFIDAYRAGIEAIDGLHILGDPHLSIVAFGSDEFDVFRVAELMQPQGWLPGLVQRPRGIHRMMSMLHAGSKDEYLRDVRAAVAELRRAGPGLAALQARY